MSEPSHLCNSCGKTYSSKRCLRAHERKHTGSAPYRCCGRMFWDKTLFTRHRCVKHNEEKKHECAVCGGKFATQNDLNKHKKMVHEEKKLPCSECTKSFSCRYDLNDHVAAAHRGEKKHICQCGKRYVYGPGLSRHKRTCQK